MTRIKFAVVGFGHIGKRHAEMIMRNSQAELLAVADSNPNEISQVDENIRRYDSLEALLQSESNVEVVVIATPNGLHASHALMCLDANKHVVIEKPMSLSKKDAELVIEKATVVHKEVFTVMQNRYSPPSVWIKNIIQNKMLGSVYIVQLNCFWNRDERYYKPGGWHGTQQLDGGTLFTQFSHFIDIIYWLFGDIENIQSRFNDFNHKELTDFEDSGFVSFDFINGGMGCINYSTSVWNKNLESSMTIIGEKGSVKIGGQYMNEVEYCHVKDYTMPQLAPTNPGNDYGAYKGSAQNHHYVIQNVIDVLQGKASITTKALEGLKVVDIIERIYQTKKQNHVGL